MAKGNYFLQWRSINIQTITSRLLHSDELGIYLIDYLSKATTGNTEMVTVWHDILTELYKQVKDNGSKAQILKTGNSIKNFAKARFNYILAKIYSRKPLETKIFKYLKKLLNQWKKSPLVRSRFNEINKYLIAALSTGNSKLLSLFIIGS